MLPDNTAIDQAITAETARLHAWIRRDISALRRLVDHSWELIEDVRRQRAAQTLVRAVGLADHHAAHE